MKIALAKRVPWSSIVGQSVTLHDADGKVIAQLAVLNVGSREAAEDVTAQIVDAFENLERHQAVLDNLHRLSTSNR